MKLLDELRELGVDVDQGLGRVMGDESLYEMMLGMFVDEVGGNPVKLEDFDDAAQNGLTERIHTLKGVTGNLAMTQLFDRYTSVLGMLREGRYDEAKAGFEEILPAQEKVLDCIRRSMNA